MDSKDSLGRAGTNIACVAARMVEIAIQRGIDAGTKSAVDYIKEEKKAQRKGRYDRRLRNTRLLLKNYRMFKLHVQGAVYTSKGKESAIDILDGLDDYTFNDDLYIESIKRSKERTLIILDHVDEMLHYYRIICEESGKAEEMRRYRVIKATYIDEEKKSAHEIGAQEHIETRTVYKDINAAIKPISALMFGIDSLKVY
jgi:hypothetical protein